MLTKEQELKDRLVALYDESIPFFEECQNKDIVQISKDLKRKLLDGHYNIAVIGFMNRGKSTLLNAFLGRNDLAPAKPKVCTATIVKYMDKSLHDNKEGAQLVYDDNTFRTKDISIAELPNFIDNEKNEDNCQKILDVEVYSDFPLMGTVATMIDTPGRGSVFGEHDALSARVLPEADAIILPIAANPPLEADERAFLRRLPNTIKQKMIFVITKVDELSSSDVVKVENYVRQELEKLEFGSPDIYQVSALKVVEAREQRKTPEEIEAIKQDCGMAALESVVEQIVKGARFEKILRACAEDLRRCLTDEKSKIDFFSTENSDNITTLLENKAALKKGLAEAEKKYQRAKVAFQRNWNYEIKCFLLDIKRIKPGLLKDLRAETKDAGLLSLIGSTSAVIHNVQTSIESELGVKIPDLEKKLRETVEKFALDMQIDVDGDVSAAPSGRGVGIKTQLLSEGGTLASIGLIGAGGIWGVTKVTGAIGTVNTALSALSAAPVAVQAAAANVGFFEKIARFFVGANAVKDTAAAASAAAAAASAQAGLITAISSSILPLSLGIIVPHIAFRVGTVLARSLRQNQVPQMVDEQLTIAATEVETSLEQTLKTFLDEFEINYKQKTQEDLDQLTEIAEKMKNNDPAQKEQLARQSKQVSELLRKLDSFDTALSVVA
ncbi:hypothetical protein AGMMS49944_16750 [Spirochaetia bacterium]|nr:hypothetical protein AGMMS49944_16750 [Spirochaetia bacterium]